MVQDKDRFKCLKCGQCCTGVSGYVWMTIAEIKSSATKLLLSLDHFGLRYLRRVGSRFSLLEKPSGECIFYEKEEGCRIYETRPRQCRAFPKDSESYSFPMWMMEDCAGMKNISRYR